MLIGLLLLSGLLSAGTIELRKARSNALQDAIDTAYPNDTIIVHKGTYYEHDVKITKPLTILGMGYPVVDANYKSGAITILADSVTITGLDIRNVGTSYIEDWSGITANDHDFLRIENNKLLRSYFGIYLKNVKHSVIRNNFLLGEAKEEVNSGNGIHLWSCENILVEGNTIDSHRDGIYFEFVNNSEIRRNISVNNIRYGLHFMFSNHDKYISNRFENNGTGVAVMFSKWIEMTDNTFVNNWGSASYGLLLKEIYDGVIQGNNFEKNTIALYGDGAVRIDIAHNDFKNNGWAMNMLGSSTDCEVMFNNFLGNSFDLATNTERNKNTYASNYWDQYSGYDLDKDGIGDVPYRPIKLFSYVIGRVPESIILFRSFFIDVLNFAEMVTPLFTPQDLMDESPQMKIISHAKNK